MGLKKPELRVLERIFTAEIENRLPFSTRWTRPAHSRKPNPMTTELLTDPTEPFDFDAAIADYHKADREFIRASGRFAGQGEMFKWAAEAALATIADPREVEAFIKALTTAWEEAK